MGKGEILVRHQLEEIMKYKDKNNLITNKLAEYCINPNTSCVEIRPEFKNGINIIINSRFNNEDPSNILMKQNIRNILNKINITNFTDCMQSLKTMKISSINFFKLLAIELIERSMNDPVATQTFDPSDTDIFISDINARVTLEFSSQTIPVQSQNNNQSDNQIESDTNNVINFRELFVKELRSQFMEFMDHSKKFDNFNQHRNNNYLGFMNFLGILHNLGVIPTSLTKNILQSPLKKLIFNKDWDIIEATHAYTGFSKFVKQILYSIEKNQNKSERYEKSYLELVKQILNSFEEKNKILGKFRRGTLSKHNKFIERLDNVINNYPTE